MKKNKTSQVFSLEDELTNTQNLIETIKKYSFGSAVLKGKSKSTSNDLSRLKMPLITPESYSLSECLKLTYSW